MAMNMQRWYSGCVAVERGVSFSFRERMRGPMARGVVSPRVGAERGRVEGTQLVCDFVVTIDDLAACCAAPDHPARLGGTVSFEAVAMRAAISEGSLQLYVPDPETGFKQIRYRAAFQGRDGRPYRLEATKFIRPGRATVREQVTAYTRVLGAAEDGEGVIAAGVLVFRLRDLLAFVGSMRADGLSRLAGIQRFLAFARRELATPVTVRPTASEGRP